jgi:hypothetical protein
VRTARVLLALVLLSLVASVIAVPAAAEVDLGLEMSIDTGKPLKGSNITVTVVVTDVGGLDPGEWANGTLTVSAGTNVLGTGTFDLDNTTGEERFTFFWVPTDTGKVTLTAEAPVTGDTDASNNLVEQEHDVTMPSGVEEGQLSSTAALIGTVSLILFFGVIIASVLGIIPQDRLPVQPALILTTFIIMGLAYIGSTTDESVSSFSLSELASTIIIHPITALISGFLVAGALEAAGAFEAAADGLQRMEGFKLKGSSTPLFGIVGVVVVLTNLPTIIAMPCGRILAAALMPAALFFGVRVARAFQVPGLVSVVVFAFIVNAAASCGPSLIGGIGTIGEGLARLEPGSLSDAQQIGIILATGVCAMVMRFVTYSVPPDLAEEEEDRLEAERRAAEKEKEIFKEPSGPAGGESP